TRCLSDWSSDVCSSDLEPRTVAVAPRTDGEAGQERARRLDTDDRADDLGTQTEFPNDEQPNRGVHEHQARRLGERGEPDEDESRSEERRVGKGCRARRG